MSNRVNVCPRSLKKSGVDSTFVVLREKVRAVRRVRDIDGILGEVYQEPVVEHKQCNVFTETKEKGPKEL